MPRNGWPMNENSNYGNKLPATKNQE